MKETKLDTFETLRAIIQEKFEMDAAAIQPDTILEDLGIDSLHAFDIIFEVEERFDIQVPNTQVPIKTIQDVLDLIDKARQAKGA